jgi:hypothetical protein
MVKRTKVLAIAAVAAAATTLPLSASANPTPQAPPKTNADLTVVAKVLEPEAPGLAYHTPGSCSRGWVRINAQSITARQSKSATAPAAFQIVSPDGLSPMYYPCRSLEVGASYTACGLGNTGWILVAAPEYERQGWIVNQCTGDPIF